MGQPLSSRAADGYGAYKKRKKAYDYSTVASSFGSACDFVIER